MSSSASTPTSTPTPQRWSTLRPVVSSTRSPSRTPEGYAELVEFANNHATLRAWAIEGTSGHGAGLSRHLLEMSEIVIELDRPKRAARRNGAKSDPLDAIRAAREAMARPR